MHRSSWWIILALGCSCETSPSLDAAFADASAVDAGRDIGVDAVVIARDMGHEALDSGPVEGAFDTCDAPLDVSAGGAFSIGLAGTHSDYPTAFLGLACGGLGSTDACLDVVLSFHIDEARDVDIDVDTVADAETVISLRTRCTADGPLVDEVGGFSTPLRHRSLAAGTYFVFIGAARGDRVGSTSPTQLDVHVTFGSPTTAPTNLACDTAIDLGPSGHVAGSFVGLPPGPASGQSSALYYSFTTVAPSNVRVSVQLDAGAPLIVGLRTTVGAPCGSGDAFYDDWRSPGHASPAQRSFYGLAPGTHYVMLALDGIDLEPDFTLDVVVDGVTSAPTGDTCASPIAIEANVPFAGSFAGMQYDFPGSEVLGVPAPDAVHVLTLAERSDVWIQLSHGSDAMVVSLRAPCDTTPTPLEDDSGGRGPASMYLPALAAGTYYVVAGSVTASTYDLSVEAWPTRPIPSVLVTGNESCATPFDVPSEGGVFVGDTTTARDDSQSSCVATLPPELTRGAHDVVFRWTSTHAGRVLVSTVGTGFSSTLDLRSPGCAELLCAGIDTESFSTLDVTLPIGTHLFVLDGFFAGDFGAYRFELRPL